MSFHEEGPYQNRHPEQGADLAVPASEAVSSDLSQTMEGVEGHVSELAPDSKGVSQGSPTQKTAKTQAAQAASLQDDRAALRARLLAKAPQPKLMQKQVKEALETRQQGLERALRKYRSSAQYHQLSLVIMQLREVMKQIEHLAHMSYDALQNLWLKVVHQFA